MKILLGYSSYPYEFDIAAWNEAWISRMRSAGFEVEGFCLTIDPPGGRLTWPELDRMWKSRDKKLLSFYDRLLHRLEGFDALLNYNGINLHPEFVEQLPCVSAYSCSDDPESSDDLSRPVAAAYDLCLVGNIAAVDAYRSWGVRDARFWPLGFRHGDFDPSLDEEAILRRERNVPLALLCERLGPWRKQRLDRFAAAFPEGVFHGPGWPNGFLPEAHRVPLLQKTRIGVNFHNSSGPINFRTYYLPANGILQICDNRSNFARLFELGREAAGFDTVDEAIDLCRHYLAHEQERLPMAVAGWKRAMRDYSEVAVFKKLVLALEEAVSPPQPTRFTPVVVPSGKPFNVHLHLDDIYTQDQWHRRFGQQLEEVHRIPVKRFDLLGPGALDALRDVGEHDALIGRFGHHPRDLAQVKPIFGQLERLFHGRIFPATASYSLYDDKRAQADVFQANGWPMPYTTWLENEQDLETFLKGTGLGFPLVQKTSGGAGSTGVSLAASPTDLRYPCLVQEFCPGNTGDLRLNVIGDRVMGFRRRNRPGDFRASGSGLLDYPSELPQDAIELAWKISTQAGFDSMAYDFVRRGDAWTILEISYAYVDAAVRDCAFYYDMKTGAKTDKRGVYPEDFILEDFLSRHYQRFRKSPSLATVPKRHLPRVLVIADVRNWIFERHALTLQALLADEFEIHVAYKGDPIDENGYDLIYPLEWNLVPETAIGNPSKWVTGIRSHVTWQALDRNAFGNHLRSRFSAVHVVSRRIESLLTGIHPRLLVLTHGIDLKHFHTDTQPSDRVDALRVGWAGNRAATVKGFGEFIEPLGRIPGVSLEFCGYSDHLLDFEEMKRFYASIDVYVCSSATEGNNNTLLEAAAMGRAIVTTDVGTVPEYLEDGVSALIVPRNADAIREAVLRLLNDGGLRRRLGAAAKSSVRQFSWEVKSQQHREFFRWALRRSAEGSAEAALKLVESVQTHLRDKAFEKAIVALDEAIQICPLEQVEALARTRNNLLAKIPSMGGGIETRKLSGQADAIQVSNPLDAELAAVDRLWSSGEREAACAKVAELDERFPSRKDLVRLLAWMNRELGRSSQAQVQYARLVMLDPEDLGSHELAAAHLIAEGRAMRAESHLRKIFSARPDQPDVLLALARICLATERTREAAELYRWLAEEHPDHPGAQEARRAPVMPIPEAQDLEAALRVLEERVLRCASSGRQDEFYRLAGDAVVAAHGDTGRLPRLGEFLARLRRPAAIGPSPLATKLLGKLQGLEIGGSAHNPFGLGTRNVGMLQGCYVTDQLRHCGHWLPVDIEADAASLPVPDESEDFILSSHVLEHVADVARTLLEWFRAVRKGGYLYIVVPLPGASGADLDKEPCPWSHVFDDLLRGARAEAEPEQGEPGGGHYHLLTLESLRAISRELFGDRCEIVASQEIDDKVGNGCTLVLRKTRALAECFPWSIRSGDDVADLALSETVDRRSCVSLPPVWGEHHPLEAGGPSVEDRARRLGSWNAGWPDGDATGVAVPIALMADPRKDTDAPEWFAEGSARAMAHLGSVGMDWLPIADDSDFFTAANVACSRAAALDAPWFGVLRTPSLPTPRLVALARKRMEEGYEAMVVGADDVREVDARGCPVASGLSAERMDLVLLRRSWWMEHTGEFVGLRTTPEIACALFRGAKTHPIHRGGYLLRGGSDGQVIAEGSDDPLWQAWLDSTRALRVPSKDEGQEEIARLARLHPRPATDAAGDPPRKQDDAPNVREKALHDVETDENLLLARMADDPRDLENLRKVVETLGSKGRVLEAEIQSRRLALLESRRQAIHA